MFLEFDLGYRTGNYERRKSDPAFALLQFGFYRSSNQGNSVFDRSIRTGISRTGAGLYGTKVWNGSGKKVTGTTEKWEQTETENLIWRRNR